MAIADYRAELALLKKIIPDDVKATREILASGKVLIRMNWLSKNEIKYSWATNLNSLKKQKSYRKDSSSSIVHPGALEPLNFYRFSLYKILRLKKANSLKNSYLDLF